MICAKNPETMSFLQKQFSARKVIKSYVAVVEGKMKVPAAVIDAPIRRNLKIPREFMVATDGKPSQTEYKTLKSAGGLTTLSLHPKTGRTHQLRVHLKYIDHPIVGDELYRGKKYSRLMLHAYHLTIQLPGGNEKTFTAELPKEFEEIYQR